MGLDGGGGRGVAGRQGAPEGHIDYIAISGGGCLFSLCLPLASAVLMSVRVDVCVLTCVVVCGSGRRVPRYCGGDQ